jgi:lipoprotein-anchoring transpeptidase ErfK/SrfK
MATHLDRQPMGVTLMEARSAFSPGSTPTTASGASRTAALVLLLAALLAASPAMAEKVPFWGATEPMPFDTPPAQLKKGEFTWAPQVAPEGPILVLVSLEEQRAYTYRNNILIGAAMVSTGKPGHETPTGVFTTILKDKDHHSSLYNNAPMPYTQKITNDGVALHAGGIPGYPESHGCVHLPSEYARLLFDAAPKGMTVVISNKKTAPDATLHPALMAPVDPDGKLSDLSRLRPDESFRWHPEKSPEGPVSVLVSRHDARVLVMRNGIEIGRAKIDIADPTRPFGTHVYVAQEGYLPIRHRSAKDLPLHNWVGLAMPGHMEDLNLPPDPQTFQRITIPEAFLRAAYPLFVPGTTMMVTDAPVLESTTNVSLTLFDTLEPTR